VAPATFTDIATLREFTLVAAVSTFGANLTGVEVPERVFWNLDDLDAVCQVFLYSTIQPSRHRWAYDARTLLAALERAGFHVEDSIRPDDPRLSCPRWYDLGYQCIKRERRK